LFRQSFKLAAGTDTSKLSLGQYLLQPIKYSMLYGLGVGVYFSPLTQMKVDVVVVPGSVVVIENDTVVWTGRVVTATLRTVLVATVDVREAETATMAVCVVEAVAGRVRVVRGDATVAVVDVTPRHEQALA
jgi:hypothetical protein